MKSRIHQITVQFPVKGPLASCRVFRQTDRATAALPYEASNGVTLRASPTGLPFIASRGGKVTVALRCPGKEPLGLGLEYGGRAADFGSPEAALAATGKAKAAIREFRQAVRGMRV